MKVYLSSTYSDLVEYRQEVYQALRKIRQDVISMEDYTAGDQRPLDKCLKDVASADVYVGLFAWRYGHVPKRGNAAGKSITELEFRHAVRLGKTCLLFLLPESARWPIADTDFFTGDGDGGRRIKALRDEFKERYMVGLFTTPQEAANEVMAALFRAQLDEELQTDTWRSAALAAIRL